MDHKISKTKKSKKPGCLIAFLVLVILILAVFGYQYLQMQKMAATVNSAAAAAAAPVTTTVEAAPLKLVIDGLTGTVNSNQTASLYWQTSGTVAYVNVKVGDIVKQDQVLASLDPESLEIDIINADVDLESAEDAMTTLKNTAESVSKALSEMVTAQSDLESAQNSYDSLDPSRATEDAIKIAYETYLKTQNDYDSALAKFDVTRNYALDDATRIKRLGDVGGYRSVRDNALAEYHRYLGQGNELERLVREAKLQLAKATLEEKQYQYQKALKGATEAQIAAAQAKIDAATNKKNSSKLIAPFEGTITQLGTKVGDTVSASSMTAAAKTLAVQIDDITKLSISFTVSELVVNQIQPGQAVKVTFMAIPEKTYNGIVTKVADTGTTTNQSVSFKITLELIDADAKVKPGMTADLSMTVADFAETLQVPLSSILVKDGKNWVYLQKEDGGFETVEIKTGLVSGMNVQVLSENLKKGDVIQQNVTTQKADTGEDDMMMMFGGGVGF